MAEFDRDKSGLNIKNLLADVKSECLRINMTCLALERKEIMGTQSVKEAVDVGRDRYFSDD